MIGQNYAKFLAKSKLEAHQEKFGELAKEKIGYVEFETEIRNRKVCYLKDNIAVLNDKNGEVIGILGASKKITEKVLAEPALHQSMDRLELVLDSGGLGLWDYSLQSQELVVSEQWTKMLGLEPNTTITAKSFSKLIHPDDVQPVNDALLECIKKHHKEFNMEFRMKHSGGTWDWILSRGKIMELNKHWGATRSVGANVDITETKHLELELQRQVNIYSSFINLNNS